MQGQGDRVLPTLPALNFIASIWRHIRMNFFNFSPLKRKKLKTVRTLLALILLTTFTAAAQPTTYHFCVKTDKLGSFKAEVTFRAVDFGELTAKELLLYEVRPALGDTVNVVVVKGTNCPCGKKCQVFKLTPTKISGNMGDNYDKGGAKTIPASSAAAVDCLIYEAKSLFDDPAGFLKRNIFGIKD